MRGRGNSLRLARSFFSCTVSVSVLPDSMLGGARLVSISNDLHNSGFQISSLLAAAVQLIQLGPGPWPLRPQ